MDDASLGRERGHHQAPSGRCPRKAGTRTRLTYRSRVAMDSDVQWAKSCATGAGRSPSPRARPERRSRRRSWLPLAEGGRSGEDKQAHNLLRQHRGWLCSGLQLRQLVQTQRKVLKYYVYALRYIGRDKVVGADSRVKKQKRNTRAGGIRGSMRNKILWK